MMLRKKSSKRAPIKVLIAVPLVAVMFIAFAQPEVEKEIGDVFMQDNPESVVKKVQTDPFFYWNQVQEYCEKKGLEPKDLKIPDNGKNDNLVVMLINSVNQVMYRNSTTHRWFKTPEEAKSGASVQALKATIVEAMKKSGDNSVYFILQNDIASSTNFIVHFINTTLPKAYEEALIEMSTYKNVSVGDLKEKYSLLLLYSHPMVYAGNANKRVKAKEDNSKTFVIRTSAEKDGKEEMAFWKIVFYNGGNGVQSASIRQVILSESQVMDEKSLSDSAILQPADFALVSVGKDLNKKDIEGVKHILDKRFEVKNFYFILGI